MEFRSPTVAAQQNAKAITFLTENLSDPDAGRLLVQGLISELGNVVDRHPSWHPLLTRPPRDGASHVFDLFQLPTYSGIDHTICFVRGFVTCPYSKEAADRLVDRVSSIRNLHAERIDGPLYSDDAHPVLVVADDVEMEADGTINSRDAIAWFVQDAAAKAGRYQVAETWWTIRTYILGYPHGSRSSLSVNQHSGSHMRKILEAMNASGMFGPIKEDSLDMLSKAKRDAINGTLIRAAIAGWDRKAKEFKFQLRDETCKAEMRDVWGDGTEISVRVEIGDYDLLISGHYHPKGDRISASEPKGRQDLAKKFV